MKEQQTCQVVRDLLPLYQDDLVSEGSRALVEEHLQSCEDCQEALRRMREPLSVEHAPEVELDYLKKVNNKMKLSKRIALGLAALLILVGLGALVKVYLIGTLVNYTDVIVDLRYDELTETLEITGRLRDTGVVENLTVGRIKVKDDAEREMAIIEVYAVRPSPFHRDTEFSTTLSVEDYEWVNWQGPIWERTLTLMGIHVPRLQMVMGDEERACYVTDFEAWPDFASLIKPYQITVSQPLAETLLREDGTTVDFIAFVEPEEYGAAYRTDMPFHYWVVQATDSGYYLGHYQAGVYGINDDNLAEVETIELYMLSDARYWLLYELALQLLD